MINKQNKTILIIAHAHPDFSKGGGEIAAYQLFQTLNQHAEQYKTLFLARHELDKLQHVGTPISAYKKNEYLLYSKLSDFFILTQAYKRSLWKYFAGFLKYHQPDIIHLHHYIHLGIEIFKVIRNTLPECKIVLTLHEYIGICHHNGQMIKTKNSELCQQASPIACHQCYPERSPEDFFLREQFIKSFLELVDIFISPSQFLIQRYKQWGLDSNKIFFIENGQEAVSIESNKLTQQDNIRTNFAFFGQLSSYKGIKVLFKAFELLPKNINKQVNIAIHGAGLESQDKAFQKYFEKSITSSKSNLNFYGKYQSEQMQQIMQTVDWVIIPSIWWENSPLVIQEAFKYKKPVICSDIGGMAEKVQHLTNGIHFRANNPQELASTIKWLITKMKQEPKYYQQLVDNIPPTFTHEHSMKKHLEIYEQA